MASSDSGVESNADMDAPAEGNKAGQRTSEPAPESRNAVVSPSESSTSDLSSSSPSARRKSASERRRSAEPEPEEEEPDEEEHAEAEEEDEAEEEEEEEGDVEDDDVDEELMEVSQEDDDEPYRQQLSVGAETASLGCQSPPRDMVVCGACRREFQLSDFAGFIEHKVTYCHQRKKRDSLEASPSPGLLSPTASFGRARRKRTSQSLHQPQLPRSASAHLALGREVATETDKGAGECSAAARGGGVSVAPADLAAERAAPRLSKH